MDVTRRLLPCRLWPPLANSLHPKELHPVISAMLSCLIDSGSNIVWAEGCLDLQAGQWVSLQEACFLPRDHKLSKTLVEVGRRAKLLIADVPADILQVRQYLIRVQLSRLSACNVWPMCRIHFAYRFLFGSN